MPRLKIAITLYSCSESVKKKGLLKTGLLKSLKFFNKEVGGTAELKSRGYRSNSQHSGAITLEALHVCKERPKTNTRDEFKSRQFFVNLKSKYTNITG